VRRVKIGVIGCGAIAQVHHMPNLKELQDEFEVTAVCDVSVGAAQYVANRFHVPQYFTDYRDLLASDVEAVILCQTDPKKGVAVDAFDAGKHAFVEKPVCFSLQECDEMIDACKRAGTVGQAGYMKVYDPAFERAKQEAEEMDVRFVQINHLHPDNALHLQQFDVRSFGDLPEGAFESAIEGRQAAREQAIGEAAPHVERAFHLLAGSMIHDLYGLREIMGMPVEVSHTEIWQEGRAVTFTLVYENNARCVGTWIDLPDLWDFKETLEIYGDDKRVIVNYPTGFSRGILSTVSIQGIDSEGRTYRTEPYIDWDSAFVQELRHFHDCIVNGKTSRTSLEHARNDVKLIIDIIGAYKG